MTNKTNILSALGLVGTMIRDSLAAPFTTTDVISVNNRTEEETSTELVVKVTAMVVDILALGVACGIISFVCSYLRDKGCYDSKDNPLEGFLSDCERYRKEDARNGPESLNISTVDLPSTDHVHDDNDDNLSSISAARCALPDIVSHTISNLIPNDSDKEESLINTMSTNEEIVIIGDIHSITF
ncbi:MAG: hypothetical protein QMO91_04815 [Candidatus Tisiphia sp.]|nr:hypothetical protein [Candidatus Tisiphia sp.]